MLSRLWNWAFLEERPSVGLCLFRPFVAFTVGAHIIPTLFHMKNNYLAGSFREKNPSFFPIGFLEWVDKSPDGVVWCFVILFAVSLGFFALGFFSQISCILMVISCTYFYALNSLHIGTLSYDILLVTLFLMCVSGYHGDSFSLDSIRRADTEAYERKRPYFVQRLLQIQIASTYFFTATYKFTGEGNWFTDNPMYYLFNSVPQSVVKPFPFRAFFAHHPTLCYWIGIGVICMELSIPFLLFIKRTRITGILVGFFFHILLLVTLHVPTIFFFLFPPQLLLFIDPESILAWIEKKQAADVTNSPSHQNPAQ